MVAGSLVVAGLAADPSQQAVGAQEAGGELVPGQAESAPHDFKPLRITLWTTLVATVLFGLYYANYVNEWLTPAMLDFSGQS